MLYSDYLQYIDNSILAFVIPRVTTFGLLFY